MLFSMCARFVLSAAILILFIASLKAETLQYTFKLAYAYHEKRLELPVAIDLYAAQKQMVKLANINRSIADDAANAYAEIYYARKHHRIMQYQLEFIKQQVKRERKKLAQGLTTKSNLTLLKAYEQKAERNYLLSTQLMENKKKKFHKITGSKVYQTYNTIKFNFENLSLKHFLANISLSHPLLMQQAYSIKNIRSEYAAEKKNPPIFRTKLYGKKLLSLEKSILNSEAVFDDHLAQLSLQVKSLYKAYEWAKRQKAIDKERIETTSGLFTSALEERKHELKNSPDVMIIFDQAIEARLDYLQSEKKAIENILKLASVMGKLVPDEFLFKGELTWKKNNKALRSNAPSYMDYDK